jgi:hypothetical protein
MAMNETAIGSERALSERKLSAGDENIKLMNR